jgi:hypothetical protein
MGVDCIHLAQDGDHRRVTLYMETESFISSEEHIASIFKIEG